MELYSAHPCALTLHFHTSPFILKLSPGAENKHVNIFNLIWFLKSEVLLLKGCAKASGILFFFFPLGGVLHRSLIAD